MKKNFAMKDSVVLLLVSAAVIASLTLIPIPTAAQSERLGRMEAERIATSIRKSQERRPATSALAPAARDDATERKAAGSAKKRVPLDVLRAAASHDGVASMAREPVVRVTGLQRLTGGAP